MGGMEKKLQTKRLNAGNQLYYSHSDTQNSKLLLLPQKETLKNHFKFLSSYSPSTPHPYSSMDETILVLKGQDAHNLHICLHRDDYILPHRHKDFKIYLQLDGTEIRCQLLRHSYHQNDSWSKRITGAVLIVYHKRHLIKIN